ncbi:unnamed protein product, partial [Closterium sp. NIES-53]
HRKVHCDVAMRVLRYLCSTSGMGLGYTFTLGSGSVSWRSTRSSSVLSSSCEAEIYAGAMAAQELRWLTYLLTDLGEAPHSPRVLYVDNKAMLALCQEHRLEHRTKHIALRYFLARELQQRGKLRLAYVASRANTADVFTKALQPCDHQPCFAFPDWSCGLLFSPTLPMGSQPPLLSTSPPPAPSPYTEQSGSLTERREPASRTVWPVHTARHIPRSRPPPVPVTHAMALRPSFVPLRVPLPAPPESSLPKVPDPESDRACAASPTVSRLLATAVTDPSFESAAASALIAELFDYAAASRLDYAAALVVESEQEDFECLAAAVPRFASMLLASEGDSDAPDIPTPRSYADAITGSYSSQWQAVTDAEMASWKSTGTYVDEVPPPGANIVDGMWIFRGSLHEEKWLRRPPGFTGSFPGGTQWNLRRPFYGLCQVPCEWHDTLRTTLAALGFAPSTADPSLFLRTDTSLPPFYILISWDRAWRTITRTQSHMVHQVLQRFGFQFSSPQPTPLSTSHSLSAPPSDESVEPSGLYPELVGCLMYLITCTQPDLAYPLSLLACYVAPGPVVLTGHADASWIDDSATQRSSQGYTFSLGSGSVSWRSTRSSLVLSSNCEAKIYARAMAAQELRWLTYLLTDLGEHPRSPPVLYVDNKATIALCHEHRLEHQTKHITLRYFLARELQEHGQLRLAYVATRANTAVVFTKALPPGDHQRFSTV